MQFIKAQHKLPYINKIFTRINIIISTILTLKSQEILNINVLQLKYFNINSSDLNIFKKYYLILYKNHKTKSILHQKRHLAQQILPKKTLIKLQEKNHIFNKNT